uniref:Uncharacterized protein n=1 Tax=Phakopsora pachyrhizi TaxID=170000 RepID=A0A0S1MIN0_PHAPC
MRRVVGRFSLAVVLLFNIMHLENFVLARGLKTRPTCGYYCF